MYRSKYDRYQITIRHYYRDGDYWGFVAYYRDFISALTVAQEVQKDVKNTGIVENCIVNIKTLRRVFEN